MTDTALTVPSSTDLAGMLRKVLVVLKNPKLVGGKRKLMDEPMILEKLSVIWMGHSERAALRRGLGVCGNRHGKR